MSVASDFVDGDSELSTLRTLVQGGLPGYETGGAALVRGYIDRELERIIERHVESRTWSPWELRKGVIEYLTLLSPEA